MGGWEVKRTAHPADRTFGGTARAADCAFGAGRANSYTEAWTKGDLDSRRIVERLGLRAMVESRIKPYGEQVAEQERRAAQRRAFVRNQTIGLVILAAAICLWWLFHTNPKWIFPPGWWRL
jgi:hypothetical protein